MKLLKSCLIAIGLLGSPSLGVSQTAPPENSISCVGRESFFVMMQEMGMNRFANWVVPNSGSDTIKDFEMWVDSKPNGVKFIIVINVEHNKEMGTCFVTEGKFDVTIFGRSI